jgi:hypothetical protein
MASVNLNLPDEVKAVAEARAAESGFPSLDKYVEELVRADAGASEDVDDDLEQLLASRLDGPTVEMNDADFASIRAKFESRLQADQQREQRP